MSVATPFFQNFTSSQGLGGVATVKIYGKKGIYQALSIPKAVCSCETNAKSPKG